MRRLHTPTLALSAVLFGLVPGCDEGPGTMIGPDGGTITSDDGRMTLELPPGALAEDVRISIEQTEDSPDGALGTAYAVEPAGLSLHWPAKVVFDLPEDEGDDESEATDGVTERRVQLERTVIVGQRGSDGWPELADHDADLGDRTVTATALYLSVFALVADVS